jgi:peroxiredoxin
MLSNTNEEKWQIKLRSKSLITLSDHSINFTERLDLKTKKSKPKMVVTKINSSRRYLGQIEE